MSRRVMRIGIVSCIAFAAASAGAFDYVWIHPCPCGDRDGGNPYWQGGASSYCAVDWNEGTAWTQPTCSPPPSCVMTFPNDTGDSAIITYSTHSCCVTGDCDCSQHSDCIHGCSGSCDDASEQHLEISLVTVSIDGLEINTESTTATTDQIVIKFESEGSTAKTLTCNYVDLDATNGTIWLSIKDNATITTE